MGAPRLSDVVGQDRAVSRLRAVMASGRVHHAWIFHGPEGVGKRLAAEAFAGALLDPTTAARGGGEVGPEEGSETRRLLRAGLHPDLHVVSKELASYSRDDQTRDRKQSTIPIEVVREFLLEPAALAAGVERASLARKVFIVEEAHLMCAGAAPAANAALKTLEEPPPGVVIVLLTDEEGSLLPTIRSRCQRVGFGALDEQAMERWLSGWKPAGAAAAPTGEEKAWLLRYAAGSPGRYASAAEGGLHALARAVWPMLSEAERGRYAAEFGPTLKEWIEGWAKSWVDARENASKEAANKAGAGRVFALLSSWARDRLREAASRGAGDPAGLERAARDVEAIAEAERMLDANANMDLALDHLGSALALSRG